MKIVAIIVTYNAMKWVDRCLGSLRNSTIPIKPVVIDNGSTDGTREYIPANFSEVEWMTTKENLGFGQANNLGLRYALETEADYVLLLNQDAWIDSDMIEKLLAVDDGRTLMSPIHLNGRGDNFDKSFYVSTICRSSNIRSFEELRTNPAIKPFEADAVAAAIWLLPIRIIKEVGGFNPLFFHYGEDHNYLDRVCYHKFSVKIVPTTFAYHDRIEVGNPVMFNREIVYRFLLLLYTNINTKPNLKETLRICGYWCREGLYNKKLFRMIGESLTGLWKIWCNRRRIAHSRSQEKITQTSWL